MIDLQNVEIGRTYIQKGEYLLIILTAKYLYNKNHMPLFFKTCKSNNVKVLKCIENNKFHFVNLKTVLNSIKKSYLKDHQGDGVK